MNALLPTPQQAGAILASQRCGHTPYFSPRQKEEQRKAERNRIKTNKKNNVPGKSARLSLQYSSSPLKQINNNGNQFNQSELGISGISPIKSTEHHHKRGKSKNKRLKLRDENFID